MELWWLFFKNQTPPPWATAQKLQEELDFLNPSLVNKKLIAPAHSVIKTINKDTKITPPLPKYIPKRIKVCPKDSPGPLESPFCKSTCAKPCAMTGTGTAWSHRSRTSADETTSVGGKQPPTPWKEYQLASPGDAQLMQYRV